MGIIQASIPLFLALLLAELAFARAGHRPFYRLNDSIADLSCGILSQLAGLFTKLLTVGLFAWVETHWRVQRWLPVPEWPAGAPLRGVAEAGVAVTPSSPWSLPLGEQSLDVPVLVAWIAAFVLVDLAYYWFHRVSHESSLFWAGHVVHHSSEEYNLAVALRQSALGGLLSWVFYLPLAFLGMPWEVYVSCYALNLVYQFWIHTRAIGRLPAWAEAVLNTPSHHRVHHGVNPAYQDRNYAGVFIVWDRWFGTFTPEREEPVYGLTTPLASWNPLWAQVHGYVEIVRRVRRAETWGDRWRLVFGPPAWRPAAWGGPVAIPAVSRATHVPYDTPTPRALSRYALGHFAVTLVGAFLLLTFGASLGTAQLAAGAFYVALSLGNVGGVLEGRRWAFAAEAARLGALGCASLALVVAPATWLARAGVGHDAVTAWRAGGASLLAVLAVSALVLVRERAWFVRESDEAMDHAH